MKDERLVLKMDDKTIYFEASETVWWRDLTDPDPVLILRHSLRHWCRRITKLGLFGRYEEGYVIWELFYSKSQLQQYLQIQNFY